MRQFVISLLVVVSILGGCAWLREIPKGRSDVQLTSSAWQDGGTILPKYTCDGEDVSPPLAISDVPNGTKSLVLIVHDPDAPAKDWVHWTLWNIDPTTTEIAEASVPPGAVEGVTDFGQPGYGGPCPPSGSHRYVFELSALDTPLSLPPATSRDTLEQTMAGHVLATATLTSRYQRQ